MKKDYKLNSLFLNYNSKSEGIPLKIEMVQNIISRLEQLIECNLRNNMQLN